MTFILKFWQLRRSELREMEAFGVLKEMNLKMWPSSTYERKMDGILEFFAGARARSL